MNLGFTGTREGLTIKQAATLREVIAWARFFNVGRLHHGGCIGADEEAHKMAVEVGLAVYIHPPTVTKYLGNCVGAHWTYKPKPYLLRNRDIVMDTDALIACPRKNNEEQRSGTWSTIRYARACGVGLLLIYPNGSMKRE